MATERDKLILEITTDDKGTPVVKNFRKTVKDTETSVTKGAKQMTSSFSSMWKGMAVGQLVAQGVMRSLRAIGGFLTDSSNLARDAAETHQKFEVVFSDAADRASASVKDLNDNWGLAKSTAEGLLSSTGDLLTGLGLTGDVALDLSEKTQKLAIDLASFTNFQGGAERASLAITKAMLGERESMKLLGVVITEKMIQERLALKGQKDLTGQALLQAKAIETLNIVVEQSKNAIGDYARTSGSLANVQRELGERIKEVQEGIGNSINEALLPVLRLMVKWLKENADEIEAFFKEDALVIRDLVEIMGIAVGKISEFADVVVKNARAFVSVFGAIETVKGAFEESEAEEALGKSIDKLNNRYNELIETLGLTGLEVLDIVLKYEDITDVTKRYTAMVKDLEAKLEPVIKGTGSLTKATGEAKEQLIDLPKPLKNVATNINLVTDALIENTLEHGRNKIATEDSTAQAELLAERNRILEQTFVDIADKMRCG